MLPVMLLSYQTYMYCDVMSVQSFSKSLRHFVTYYTHDTTVKWRRISMGDTCLDSKKGKRRTYRLFAGQGIQYRHCTSTYPLYNIQGVSGGTVNILGGGSMDYSE